jgi:hypothetical protein
VADPEVGRTLPFGAHRPAGQRGGYRGPRRANRW